ncbi:MAG: hypothetical protein AB8G77_18300 [Rhodothermales bacterium]
MQLPCPPVDLLWRSKTNVAGIHGEQAGLNIAFLPPEAGPDIISAFLISEFLFSDNRGCVLNPTGLQDRFAFSQFQPRLSKGLFFRLDALIAQIEHIKNYWIAL